MRFTTPTSFLDLERHLYHHMHWITFDSLVNLLDDVHLELNNDGMSLFCNNECEDNDDATWCDAE